MTVPEERQKCAPWDVSPPDFLQEGVCVERQDGTGYKVAQYTMKDGKYHGLFEQYDLTYGTVHMRVPFQDGIPHGLGCVLQPRTGEMEFEVLYRNGKCIPLNVEVRFQLIALRKTLLD